ncbi:hypothetical protein ACFC63_07225 [Streptomyces albidoflavus]
MIERLKALEPEEDRGDTQCCPLMQQSTQLLGRSPSTASERQRRVKASSLKGTRGTPLLVLSIVGLMEQASRTNDNQNLVGDIRDLDQLLARGVLERLQETYKVVAFLAFDPRVDTSVVDYVRSGALADDSGPDSLVLFALDGSASTPRAIDAGAFEAWLSLEQSTSISHQLVRTLFEPEDVPVLPGLAFFHGAVDDGEVVWVPLGGLETPDRVRDRVQTAVNYAVSAHRAGGLEKYPHRLRLKLQGAGIPFIGTGRASFREWLRYSLAAVREKSGEIVAAIGLFGAF